MAYKIQQCIWWHYYYLMIRLSISFDLRIYLSTSSQKHRFYLTYSWSYFYLNRKQNRYFSRDHIIHFNPYNIQFQAYELKNNEIVQLATVWNYFYTFIFFFSIHSAKFFDWNLLTMLVWVILSSLILCICSINRFSCTCHLDYDDCYSQSWSNNTSIYITNWTSLFFNSDCISIL